MKKVLFIDRDGCLIIEPPDEQIDSLEKLEFYAGVFGGLGKIARLGNFELVMVTNQDGLGTPSFPEETFWPAHNKMLHAFENEGIIFSLPFPDLIFWPLAAVIIFLVGVFFFRMQKEKNIISAGICLIILLGALSNSYAAGISV